MGFVERDARLFDWGVEVAADEVAADGSVGGVLVPLEVEVDAGFLRLLPDEAEGCARPRCRRA